MSWRLQAACRGVNPELFFPAPGQTTAQAKAICASCPVATSCRDENLFEQFGVWGGTSERQRQRIRGRRRVAVSA